MRPGTNAPGNAYNIPGRSEEVKAPIDQGVISEHLLLVI
jgi:hypothetical protein